jgi:hypothetical protein
MHSATPCRAAIAMAKRRGNASGATSSRRRRSTIADGFKKWISCDATLSRTDAVLLRERLGADYRIADSEA